MCLSNSAVMFLLLRLSQGSMLAGVFVSSYIASEYPVQTFNCCPTLPMVKFPAGNFSNFLLFFYSGDLEKKNLQLPQPPGPTALFILESTFELLHFFLSHLLALYANVTF